MSQKRVSRDLPAVGKYSVTMRAFLLVLLIGVCGVSAAQSSFPRTLNSDMVGLLQFEAVQKEVKLSESQKKKIDGHFAALKSQVEPIMKSNPTTEAQKEAARKKIQAASEVFHGKALGELSAVQKKRLREVTLQSLGAVSFLIDEVSKELALTQQQKSQVAAAHKAFRSQVEALQAKRQKEFEAVPKPKDSKDEKAVKAYVEKVQALMEKRAAEDKKTIEAAKKVAEGKMVAVLTSGQKANWTKMQGAKFNPPKPG